MAESRQKTRAFAGNPFTLRSFSALGGARR
jgi:hypothetical protein